MRRGLAYACAAAVFAGAPAPAQDGSLAVELNKLETGDGGYCRAYFLFRNRTGATFDAFDMALAILNPQGVIDRLLTIDAAPLPADRTTLKLFEIPETACDAVSEVLLHDLPECRPQDAAEIDCFSILTLDSKAGAPLVK